MRSFRKVVPEFGEAVRKILTDRGLSYRAVMYKTSINASTIGDMANGLTPSQDIIERFSEGLGIDPQPLLVSAGYSYPDHAIEGVELALRYSHDLNEEGKQRIMQFVREVKEKYGVERCEKEEK